MPSNKLISKEDKRTLELGKTIKTSTSECANLDGTKCLPMSQCNLKNLSDSDKAPSYCGFSDQTGEDQFCCAENDSVGNNSIPQPPRFNQSGKAWPCEDHTEMCTKWATKGGCDPIHDSYSFMKFACMESCGICNNNVSYSMFRPLIASADSCSFLPSFFFLSLFLSFFPLFPFTCNFM